MKETQKYNPKQVEDKIRQFWEQEEIYKTSLEDFNNKHIYPIDTPPPTVSGKMHIGHAFSYTQQDIIARFRRMFQGVFYPFGTDDNGLPTERLIEKMKNIKSKDMSRQEFIDICLKTLKEITPDFIQDWKNLGISADFTKIYSTIDDNSRRISQKSFLDLYKKDIAYKKDFPTIWCPNCQTSVAQAELEDEEKPSLFSTLKFTTNNKELLIATTRPELLSACVAVFINPSDKRYKDLIGKKAKIPIFNYEVPIIADSSANPEKGTGVLMICSYGDKFDVDAINRHNLSPRIILNKDGRLNQLAGEYQGLKIQDARKKILKDLEKNKLIKEQKSITHIVNTHDKCGECIEFLPTEQWFIRILDKKKEFLKQGKKINWYPEHMHKRYENWINGLDWDWSISRDRHFGIPIPIWYCKNCNEIILPEEKELPIDPIESKKKCPKCKNSCIPEEKVLDTWATSSLTPQIASSLFGNKINLPYELRPQAHDIIRTWAFYTIVKSYYHEGEIPWKNISVSGFVTLKGEKMAKSKGNVISPQEVMEKFPSDSIRFWASSSKLGEDMDYNEQDLLAGNKLITKLWNASNFVFMNLNDFNGESPKKLKEIDKLFLEKLDYSVYLITNHFKNYEYQKAKQELEKLFWNDFCDNYLEIIKNRIYNKEGDEKISAQHTLYNSFLNILKLFAPIVPFITEEIYQEFFLKNPIRISNKKLEKSIHISKWPISKKDKLENNKLEIFCDILTKVRQAKSEAKKSMKSQIELTIREEKYNLLEELI
jgi:valyl-tRNA synthetase